MLTYFFISRSFITTTRKKLNCSLRLACFTATTSRVANRTSYYSCTVSGLSVASLDADSPRKEVCVLWIQVLFAVDPNILHMANNRFLPCSYLLQCAALPSRQMSKKTRAVAVCLLTSTAPFGSAGHRQFCLYDDVIKMASWHNSREFIRALKFCPSIFVSTVVWSLESQFP